MTKGLTISANTLRYADFLTRVESAAAAGFSCIGLRLSDYFRARADGFSDTDLQRILADHRIGVLELEHNYDWVASNASVDPNPDFDDELLFHVADVFQARQFNACLFYPHDAASTIDALGNLCDRASAHHLLVGLEFLPFSKIKTLAAASAIVLAVGRANCGVIIDAWHFYRARTSLAELEQLPQNKVTSIQLNNVLPVAADDLMTEARHHRQLPDQGSGDVVGLLSVLRKTHPDVPIAVEVFSDYLDSLEPSEAAQLAFSSSRAVLDRVSTLTGRPH
jgi:sugar phosphate isomerase/epimerase